MNYNRVCNLEDWDDPALRPFLDAVFPHGANKHRKNWEIAQAVRALQDFGALGEGKRVLGVGAGTEPTIFYLARFADVVATDLYEAGGWEAFAPSAMLTTPERFAPFEYPHERLTVQHMDARTLAFEDASFDGVFSCSSIEHFGTLQEIAQAAREIGRVLKPGGVAVLATEFQVGGEGRGGWPGVVVFNLETLCAAVVEPMGLEMVDPLDLTISEATRSTCIELSRYILTVRAQKPAPLPHVVVEHRGHEFTSVNLVLRKPL